MMEAKQVDVAIIGAGTAGMGAYRKASTYTDKIALIEGGVYGTTCARVGCMPSKLLIAAAEAVHAIEKAHCFGIHVQNKPIIKGREVMQRVRSERDRFVGFVLEDVEGFKADHKIQGFAQFLNDHTLQIDDKLRIEAKSIVIATGSSPTIAPFLQEIEDRLLTNDDIFEWEDLPKSVLVFGPGVIGLELGQALHRLGIRIRLFGRSGSMGHLSDPIIRKYAEKTFRSEFYLDANAKIQEVRREQEEVVIRFFDWEGQEQEDRFEYALAAIGRTPNIANLALENTSLTLDAKGVPLFDAKTMRCGESNIFIAGDVNNQLMLLHEAADEGRIAGENAGRYPDVRADHRRVPLSVVFCDPQIALIANCYRDLVGQEYITGKVSFENQGRSRVMLKNKGLLHVYTDQKEGRFLGAEIFGPHAEHMAHLLSWAYQQQLTIPQMLDMPFYHPVIEEGLRTALRDANAQLQG